MSRKKKSRNPGVGSSGVRKNDKTALAPAHDKKPKKKTGKISGNRQQEAVANKQSVQGSIHQNDPRIGSKKPIDLGSPVNVNVKKNKKLTSKGSSIARVRLVDQAPTIAQQLAIIESDERLQLVLAKQENEETLSAEEVTYYNELMEQYESLSAQQQEDSSEHKSAQVDDDDLWDKLESNDFSDYE